MAALSVDLHVGSGRVPRDLGWLSIACLVLLFMCSLPYLVAAAFGPPDLDRLGTFWFVRDFSQYEAAMREGAATGGWLIHDHFTAEPHEPVLMYPLYVGLGKLAAALRVSELAVFGAAEWLGRTSLLLGVHAFTATFLTEQRARRLSVLVATATLGLTVWIAPVRALADAAGARVLADVLPSTINVYLEMSTFGVFLSAPHLMLGLALTLLCAPVFLRAAKGRLIWLAVLGCVIAVLSLVHPFNLPVLASVLMLAALGSGRQAWPAAAVVVAAAAPMALYNLLLFQADPFWSGTYGLQNTMPAPAPWMLPIDFGLVLLAAPLAWSSVRRWPANEQRLIALWIGLGLVWLYAPVPYQRRFAFGVQPALAVLAAVGLLRATTWMAERGWPRAARRLVNHGFVLAGLATSIVVYVSLIASAARNAPAEVYLWTRPEADAARWLSSHSTSADVVLASTPFANPLVGVIDGRVVHGHIVATRDSASKQAQVRQFYAAETTPTQRSQILRQSGATLVALGPHERALGAVDFGDQPELQPIYDQAGVAWFRVVRPA
ncbi:MAG TPA: hypothetical protein VFA49_06205 [Chloroflexota bacterium]|nr:hypothetical protein [Chloroflexota bacterium]